MRQGEAIIFLIFALSVLIIIWAWDKVFEKKKKSRHMHSPEIQKSAIHSVETPSSPVAGQLPLVVDLVFSDIARQLKPIHNYSVFPRKKFCDEFSLGYLLGFYDCIAQKKNIHDDITLIALGTIIFVKIYGEKEGTGFFGAALRLQKTNNSIFQQGVQTGGDDAFLFLSLQSKPPESWMRYLSVPY